MQRGERCARGESSENVMTQWPQKWREQEVQVWFGMQLVVHVASLQWLDSVGRLTMER